MPDSLTLSTSVSLGVLAGIVSGVCYIVANGISWHNVRRMPDSLTLSTSVSLGVLAGIVSGVCYIVANGISWHKSEEEKKYRLPSSSDAGVCIRCGGDKQGGLLPCICYANEPVKFEKGAWFLRQTQKALSLMPWSFSTDKLEQIDEECEGADSPESRKRGELHNVREFLESLSAKLSGGPIDGTRVAPLYDHPAYLPSRDAPPSSSSAPPSASNAHAQLKRLVARVVEEASNLPALARYAAEPSRTPSVEASTYEDLLATAILNKVIERYQHENGSGGRSSGIHSASASPTPSERSSPRSMRGRGRDLTPPLQEEDEVNSDWEGEVTEALELPRRVPFPEFGGDIVHLTDNEDRDFDEVSSSDIQAVDATWEENWLFQRKKIKTLQSAPVPMLVPNSNTEYRAMIGDRDADDTTDLSDNASEEEEEDIDYKSDIKRVLDSKHLIGGKTKVDEMLDFEPDSLTVVDDELDILERKYNGLDVNDAVNDYIDENKVPKVDTVNKSLVKAERNKVILGVDSGPFTKAEFALNEEIHRTSNGNSHDNLPDNDSLDEVDGAELKDTYYKNREYKNNTLNGHEREGEYEEAVTIPVQRYADSLRRKHFDEEPLRLHKKVTNHDDIDLIPGSIADRERKKWLKSVEMPNNPYSPEAIQKRLSAKSTSSLFDIITKSSQIDGDDDKKSYKSESSKDVGIKKGNGHIVDTEHSIINGSDSKSPSPRILKDVLAEEVPEYKRYGRDYYVKEAKASSGGRKKGSFSDTSSISSMNKSTSLDNFDREFASPGLLIKQFNSIAVNQQYTTFSGKNQPNISITIINNNDDKNNVMIEYEDANEQTLFSAKPALIDDDTDKKFEEILQSAYASEPTSINIEIESKSDNDNSSTKSPNETVLDNSFLSSSSLDDSIKIYNVQTGEVMKSKSADNISRRYQMPDRNDNIDMPDKNGAGDDSVSHKLGASDVLVSENREFKGYIKEIEEISLPKVKELAKKFLSMDNLSEPISKPPHQLWRRKSREQLLDEMTSDKAHSKQYMHSLTARSISREFREELKLSMATPLTTPGGSNNIPEGIEEVAKESSRPSSPLPEPGTIKTKLAFFESLKARLTSK